MDSLAHGSLLRYHPQDGSPHSTVVVQPDQLLEVKRAGVSVRNTYPSVEAWLLSFPGAARSDVTVDRKDKMEVDKRDRMEEKQEKEEKKEKVKEEKKKRKEALKIRLIPIAEQIYSTQWTHHLYRMIKEANPSLLKKPEVIQAFNALVDLLVDYQFHVCSMVPHIHSRYKERTIVPELSRQAYCEVNSLFRIQMNSVYRNPDTGRMVIRSYRYSGSRSLEDQKLEEKIAEHIQSTYQPLFDLVKADVLPYMAQKEKEKREKETTKRIHQLMEDMDQVQQKYESDLAKRKKALEQFMESHETRLIWFRKEIAKLSKAE